MKNARKILALLLAAAMLLSLSACGGGSLKLGRALLKTSKLKSVHTDMALQLEMQMPTLFGRSLPLSLQLQGEADSAFRPLRSSGSLRLGILGVEKETLFRLEQEEESLRAWLSEDGGLRWTEERLTPEDVSLSAPPDQETLRQFIESAGSFQEQGQESIRGREATRFEGQIRGSLLGEILAMSGAEEALRQSLGLQMDPEQLAQLEDVPLRVWVDKEEGWILRYELDLGSLMEETIQSTLAALLEDYGLGRLDPKLSLDSALLTVDLSRFNAADPGQVRPEA